MSIVNKPAFRISVGLVVAAVLVAAARRKKHAPLAVAPYVDLNKYVGEWYEIARLPASFEKDCYATKARYTLQADGSVKVENSCHKGGVEGKVKQTTGKAMVVDPVTNAKLKVQFFWPFSGDYWILEVGPDYEYAVVGEPSREYLWILSRQPVLDKVVLNSLLQRAKAKGFDTSQLIFTRH
ncbi:lipocalin family protein [Rhodocytophaga rosea]|uniref:Lipocalin family protein n=1 Tax=Rhodocytophaga rosea TaxID=2704465 RepID=A0A6C0GCK0_9BACT|nr:lipocalin family protein [Rhodocytophaga rosea]QHT65574.1 lipocalin family protein [Rhodocytophaga rosea]